MLGVIGGTGVGSAFADAEGVRTVEVDTPFGKPSGPITIYKWGDAEVAFLSRHGPGHRFNPSNVPYRANIFALKAIGVTTIIASGAVGSLREEIAPGDLVIVDQIIDKTFKREGTFYSQDMVVHVEMSHPFCPTLRQRILEVSEQVTGNRKVHAKGTYVCMEGPAFSTKAESLMHRMWGGDVIGMTVMPEAKLAREAEMSYAVIALATDYDCWKEHTGDRHELLNIIIKNLQVATENAIHLIKAAVQSLKERPIEDCDAFHALELAIWSAKDKVPAGVVEPLRPLVGNYFPPKA
eukprot:jgi/Mesvir1/17437/Mv08715-RA.1